MKRLLAVLFVFAAVPAFALVEGESSKLVGTNPGTVCNSGSDAISVLPGTTVYYCYSFTNLTNAESRVTVTDDLIGTITNGSLVGAGNTTYVIRPYPIYLDETTNVALFNATFENKSLSPYSANATATVSPLFPLQVFKSVSTEPPPACGSTGQVFADVGAPLYYCYQTVNISNITIDYAIDDDQLGSVVSNQTLSPGHNDTVWMNSTFPNVSSLTNVATWSVRGMPSMNATAPATVFKNNMVPAASETGMILLGLALIVAAIVMIRLR